MAEAYKINPLEIACEITGLDEFEVLNFVKKNLSEYSFTQENGSEIISEVFADMSTVNPSEFSRKFYNKLIQLIEEVTEMERQINKMSAKNRDAVIWARNEEWYTINKEKKRFELTDKAPEEARRSFEKYKKINNLNY